VDDININNNKKICKKDSHADMILPPCIRTDINRNIIGRELIMLSDDYQKRMRNGGLLCS